MKMFRKILIFVSLIARVFSFTHVNEIAFPILNSEDNSLSYELLVDEKHFNFQIENDVQRVRNASYDELHNDSANYKGEEHLRVLDFVSLVEKYPGYEAEEHHVITADGYNLTLHRICSSPETARKVGKPVVYIQHGLFLSSDAYVLLGPGKDIAFRLAENNYDVWIGNARGNTYSKSHIYESIESSNFWNFSFHEIGKYDLSSSIDYILEETENDYLKIIGYSIGATEAYILLSESPEYNKKVDLLVSIAPMAFWKKSFNGKNSKVREILQTIETIHNATGREEMYPQSSYMQHLWHSHCSPKNYDDLNICKQILISFFGQIDFSFDQNLLQRIMYHVPAGTSFKTLKHLLQIIDSGEFQEYDNGSSMPKNYDLSKITTANAVFTGNYETFVNLKDLTKLFQKSSNIAIRQLKTNANNEVRNLDFPWGSQTDILNDAVLELF